MGQSALAFLGIPGVAYYLPMVYVSPFNLNFQSPTNPNDILQFSFIPHITLPPAIQKRVRKITKHNRKLSTKRPGSLLNFKDLQDK